MTLGWCGVVMEIGDRLRLARERRGMTQGDLAAKLGVHPATVTLWENHKNRRQIGTKHLQKVAEALQIRVSELLGEGGDTKQASQPPATTTAAQDLAEVQLLRLFRLMPEELKLFQLAQFVECANGGKLGHAPSHDMGQDSVSACGGDPGEHR